MLYQVIHQHTPEQCPANHEGRTEAMNLDLTEVIEANLKLPEQVGFLRFIFLSFLFKIAKNLEIKSCLPKTGNCPNQ